jgi:hypothetical protein
MLKHISEIIADTPQQKAQELNAAILQAVASGQHVLIEIEQREYSAPKAYTFPQIKVRVYSPASEL